MSKKMARLKRTIVLLGMGGAAFGFFGGGFGWGNNGMDFGCVRNNDLLTFYQTVGDASIESFRDSTATIIGSDFDAVVLTPTANLMTSLYNNWVAQQFPLDVEPISANVLKQ